ncbi:carbohydrate ABC transporter permease [Eubacteriales bacterium mix99]|jgi:putative aldouronate transport system permease protein
MVKGKSDVVIDSFVDVILFIVGFISVFPLLYVFSVSLTPIEEVLKNGGFVVIPKSINLEAYSRIIEQRLLPRAMGVTVYITVLGTAINMFLSVLMAYPLSKDDLPGRKVLMNFVIFTMLFGGGTIPTYLMVKNLGLMNTYWAMTLPGAIGTYNMIVIKSFFENLPNDLFESARIDGASEFRVLWQIAIPLSRAVMMTVGLFYAVGHWSTYFPAIMYISDEKMHTLQVVLRKLLNNNPELNMNVDTVVPTQTMQMASVIFSTVPIILVYPFIQKYFTKGVMLGAIKG